MKRFSHWLNSPIDNSQLIVFRIFFGMLMFFEGIGAILTGWVAETFVEPQFTFNFIGFEFLQVLVGPQMYVVYVIMGLLGIFIMLGWQYRFSIIMFSILWGATYLLQKSHYNNHYYLVWLVAMVMAFLPANRYRSLDVRHGVVTKRLTASRWTVIILPALVAVVYFYAAIAKIYPDWLRAEPISLWFSYKSYATPFYGPETAAAIKTFFSNSIVHYVFSYAGILFDLLIIPAFLWKRTRTLALLASLIFHLTNSAIFQIGVFPYFALAFAVFFYPRNMIRRKFFPKKSAPLELSSRTGLRPLVMAGIAVFFIAQIALPVRHHFIPGKVLWTEEGHRLSWRMMLRSKAGSTQVRVKNDEIDLDEYVLLSNHMSRVQISDFSYKPDMMWQFVQIIEDRYEKMYGVDVEVYIESHVRVNKGQYHQFTDKTMDISEIKWNYFGHQPWILLKQTNEK